MFKKLVIIALLSLLPSFVWAADDDAIQTNVWTTHPPANNPDTDAAKWLTNDNGEKPRKFGKTTTYGSTTVQVAKAGQTAWYCVAEGTSDTTCRSAKGDSLGGFNILANCEAAADSATIFIPPSVSLQTVIVWGDIGAAFGDTEEAVVQLHACLDARCLAAGRSDGFSSVSKNSEISIELDKNSTANFISGPLYMYADVTTSPGDGDVACVALAFTNK